MLNPDVWIHWLHLMAAIIWVGSVIFTSLVVQPVLRGFLEPQARLAVYRELGKRFSPIQWGSWAILAATGAAKLWSMRRETHVLLGPFGRILSIKLILITFMAAISIVHTYRWGPQLIEMGPKHPDYPRTVSRIAFWGKINLALLLAIVFCAAMLHFIW